MKRRAQIMLLAQVILPAIALLALIESAVKPHGGCVAWHSHEISIELNRGYLLAEWNEDQWGTAAIVNGHWDLTTFTPQPGSNLRPIYFSAPDLSAVSFAPIFGGRVAGFAWDRSSGFLMMGGQNPLQTSTRLIQVPPWFMALVCFVLLIVGLKRRRRAGSAATRGFDGMSLSGTEC